MATYLINHLRIPGDIPNEDALSYLDQVEATVSPYGGRWLAQGSIDVIEGAWPGAVVLITFPSRESFDEWYDSPEYTALRPLRVKSSISDMVVIDSLPEGFTIKAFAAKTRESVEKSKV
ncbi:DUF1330 domain-containing protein [Paludisphaera mucosa]|uniref:DUF1330 domain-containing protein n=1 Tax=Paludisphaera mucosa TaxID=3030827 RepID=A0ABT6FLE6_9BACT|nr:DUF1330 domain-containing protein [Paludisphaera mucosa]MDG3008406.1 DUF1330 domain-containing protein [Paludisphaera mucosa]